MAAEATTAPPSSHRRHFLFSTLVAAIVLCFTVFRPVVTDHRVLSDIQSLMILADANTGIQSGMINDKSSSSSSKRLVQATTDNNGEDEEQEDKINGIPEIAWLITYPSSGTSYTMTMVERATNLSTATNYGAEVTVKGQTSLPMDPSHPEGPFWEGLSGELGAIRQLPHTYVLTKTHCGGRCVHCGAQDYVTNAYAFLEDCEVTSAMNGGHHKRYSLDAQKRVFKVVHLIRNPFDNVVARFHLDRRHLVREDPQLEEHFPVNATGFKKWCRQWDAKYEDQEHILDKTTLDLMRRIPWCRGEFYRYAQWHELALQMIPLMSSRKKAVPVLTVYYEDYEYKFNETVDRLLEFVDQPLQATPRPFRSLPTYDDHYTAKHQVAVKELFQHMTSPQTWSLLEHYFKDDEVDAAAPFDLKQ